MTGYYKTAAEKPNASTIVLASNNHQKQQIDGFGLTFAFRKVHIFLIMVVVARLCECAKSHQIIHFKWLNCMACESYLIKDVKISYMFSNWQNLFRTLKPSCKGVWEV